MNQLSLNIVSLVSLMIHQLYDAMEMSTQMPSSLQPGVNIISKVGNDTSIDTVNT